MIPQSVSSRRVSDLERYQVKSMKEHWLALSFLFLSGEEDQQHYCNFSVLSNGALKFFTAFTSQAHFCHFPLPQHINTLSQTVAGHPLRCFCRFLVKKEKEKNETKQGSGRSTSQVSVTHHSRTDLVEWKLPTFIISAGTFLSSKHSVQLSFWVLQVSSLHTSRKVS